MRFYGLADFGLLEVVDFYRSRCRAEAALTDALRDEPLWEAQLGVVAVDFGGREPVVEVLRAPVVSSRRAVPEGRSGET